MSKEKEFVDLSNKEMDILVDDYAKRRIADLEAKLAESEKLKENYDILRCQHKSLGEFCDDLKQQLAEKEKEIENKEEALKTLIVNCCHRCKDKIKFAVEQLEKLRESVSDSIEERNGCMYAFMGYLDEIEHEKIDEIIDNQIKELKGEK